MIDLLRRILAVFERHELWQEGAELVGSWCFYLYQRHLGVKPYPFKTQDVDFLLPYPYRGHVKVDLVNELEQLGFRHDFRPDGSIYLWNAELRIDFLIPERGRGRNKAIEIKPLAVKAMPLRFMDMLLQHPITVTEGGVTVSVPDPASFCLHKLLVANRRKRAESRLKDIEQALLTASIAKPTTIKQIYKDLPKTWQRAIRKTLEQTFVTTVLFQQETAKLLEILESLEQKR